jgi:hypoxanthine phosphoribosyltransferase
MTVEVYLSQEQISARVKELAALINNDYAGEEVFLVGVLNGCFIFAADLMREIKVPVTIEFMSASSYGDGTESSGELKINFDLKKDIENKNIIVVEDIVDTGLTLSKLKENLLARKPKSFKLASLLYKPARLKHPVDIDYLGFEIEDKFVIGYGLDYAGRYRELPYVGIYNPEE